MFLRKLMITVASVAFAHQVQSQETSPEKDVDLFELEIVKFDLNAANSVMARFDINGDRSIDEKEQKRLVWRDDVEMFDLNKNGKLTQIELAVREAKIRSDHHITADDIETVNRILQLHDSNKNRRLEQSECAAGWPGDPAESDKNGDGALSFPEMVRAIAFNRELHAELGVEKVDLETALSALERLDKDRDKRLDADEIRRLGLASVDRLDRDGDSKVDLSELAEMYAYNRISKGLEEEDQRRINGIFSYFDSNSDKVITVADAPQGSTPAEQDSSQGLPTQIKQFDTNLDDRITMKEVGGGIRQD